MFLFIQDWGSWGQCSQLCASGTQTRHRSVVTVESWGGSCYSLSQSRPCGQTNGGCEHICTNGQCSCYAGYKASGTVQYYSLHSFFPTCLFVCFFLLNCFILFSLEQCHILAYMCCCDNLKTSLLIVFFFSFEYTSICHRVL